MIAEATDIYIGPQVPKGLQWSRDAVIAEAGHAQMSRDILDFPLQWSRDAVIAEA